MGYSTLVRIERDGLDFSARAARGDGMAKFMEGDDQHLGVLSESGIHASARKGLAHLERPQRPSDVGEVPEERNHHDINGHDP